MANCGTCNHREVCRCFPNPEEYCCDFEPERPHGEWIDAEIPLESGGSMPIQACNLCKTFYPLAYTGGGHRFCPNCGADMRHRILDEAVDGEGKDGNVKEGEKNE